MENEVENIIKLTKSNSILLAEEVLKDNIIIGVKSLEGLGLFVYNKEKNLYERLEEFELDKIFRAFCVKNSVQHLFKISQLKELYRAIRVNLKLKIIEEFDYYDNLINLNKGILNLDTMKLLEHSSDYYFNSKINIDYDPTKTKCPEFIKFLKNLFSYKEGEEIKYDDETSDFIIQLGGLLLYPKNKIKKMFFFLGPGSNGKSMLFEVFKLFFDSKNVTSLTLEKLSSESKERTHLLYSRINISGESKNATYDTEELKKIISGESVVIDRKYKEPTEFKPRTKLLVASNTKPYFNDQSYGRTRRMVFISFKNIFVNEEEYKRDKYLKNRLFIIDKNEDELIALFNSEKQAILNLFIEGIKTLKKNKWILPRTKNIEDTETEFEEGNDPIGTFAKEYYKNTDKPESEFERLKDIAQSYDFWYRRNNHDKSPSISNNKLGARIKEIFRVEKVIRYKYKLESGGWINDSKYPIEKIEDETEEIPNIGTDLSKLKDFTEPSQSNFNLN